MKIATAAFAAAVVVFVGVSLPPPRLTLARAFDDRSVAGIVHVHTSRSDGRSAPEEVAKAAARAGLKFIVFTDHGDATRKPDPPEYRSGVLCLDAVEISTEDGHYLALDMPAAPYPLGGDARGVVEDVKRLGGFGVVAHPNSPKPDLSWDEWDAPFDGIEWLNPDTSWRLKVRAPGWRARWGVATALAGYLFRSPETIAHLMTGTELDVERWQSFARRRHVVVMAGADAHARLALTSTELRSREISLPFPSYEASFRTLSVHVQPERPLSGDAAADAALVLQALRRGHVYTAIDGIASPPAFEFTATNSGGTVGQGDVLDANGPLTLHVRSNAPASFVTTLWRDDMPFETSHETDLTRPVPADPAIYRVTISAATELGSAPWIISNPIYAGIRFAEPTPATEVVQASREIFDGRTTKWWRTETDPTSVAALEVAERVAGSELELRYGLSGGASIGQYASLGVELPDNAAPFDRLTFTARADSPVRLVVQFQPLGRSESWQRSVYIDDVDREHTIRFDEATPIGTARAAHPDPAQIHDLMFVVSTTHAKPGASNWLWIKKVALQR
jgi:hypothetical protein